jgi:hypothetical protein
MYETDKSLHTLLRFTFFYSNTIKYGTPCSLAGIARDIIHSILRKPHNNLRQVLLLPLFDSQGN